MYHGDSVWQLLFVIGIVFTNAKKFFFSHAREKRTRGGATGIPSFSFQIQFVIYSLCCSQAQQAQAIYIDDYDFE